MKKINCCICGKEMSVTEGENPFPIRAWSAPDSKKNLCCKTCHKRYVLTFLLGLTKLTKDEAQVSHEVLKLTSYEWLQILCREETA